MYYARCIVYLKDYWLYATAVFHRCLPLNLTAEDLASGALRDRVKVGASLADVDPMNLDSSVSIWKCNYSFVEAPYCCLMVNLSGSETSVKGSNLIAECSWCMFLSQVRFDSVGGLNSHIHALKEMVVFPLLYPEIFEKFRIQPPRWDNHTPWFIFKLFIWTLTFFQGFFVRLHKALLFVGVNILLYLFQFL